MVPYQIHLIDRRDYTFAIQQLDCRNDADAVARAHGIVIPRFGAGFEVWRDQRLVYRAEIQAIAR